jgi:hypothetical protein
MSTEPVWVTQVVECARTAGEQRCCRRRWAQAEGQRLDGAVPLERRLVDGPPRQRADLGQQQREGVARSHFGSPQLAVPLEWRLVDGPPPACVG